MSVPPSPTRSEAAPEEACGGAPADDVTLPLGRTLALLMELGLSSGVSDVTFREYVKGLRRLGIPFPKGTRGPGGGRVAYGLGDLMELAVALTLRVYGVLPDTVVADLRRHRDLLRATFARAASSREVALLPAARIIAAGEPDLVVDGLFLDLDLRYEFGRVARLGTPRAVTAYEAVQAYGNATRWDRACLPLDLTGLARRISRTPVWRHASREREGRETRGACREGEAVRDPKQSHAPGEAASVHLRRNRKRKSTGPDDGRSEVRDA